MGAADYVLASLTAEIGAFTAVAVEVRLGGKPAGTAVGATRSARNPKRPGEAPRAGG